jgi:excisionase family DNA binding protein
MHRNNHGSDVANLADLLRLKEKLGSVPSVRVAEAAEAVGVDPRTIQRWVKAKKLEKLRHGRITVRSVVALVEDEYSPSQHFDIFRELTKFCDKSDSRDKRDDINIRDKR